MQKAKVLVLELVLVLEGSDTLAKLDPRFRR
jgi:hypothetical protein